MVTTAQSTSNNGDLSGLSSGQASRAVMAQSPEAFIHDLSELFTDEELKLADLQTKLRQSNLVVCCGTPIMTSMQGDSPSSITTLSENLIFLGFCGEGFAVCSRTDIYTSDRPIFEQAKAHAFERGEIVSGARVSHPLQDRNTTFWDLFRGETFRRGLALQSGKRIEEVRANLLAAGQSMLS